MTERVQLPVTPPGASIGFYNAGTHYVFHAAHKVATLYKYFDARTIKKIGAMLGKHGLPADGAEVFKIERGVSHYQKGQAMMVIDAFHVRFR